MLSKNEFFLSDSVNVPMRDGTVLSADVWLPGSEGSWPVLLQRTPYNKEDFFIAQYISALNFRTALRRGYVVVAQDTRGRFMSEGSFDPFVMEEQDGFDTIAWLRQQPFCNGQVAMFGASYVGATQVLAASGHPDGLRAISPMITTARHGETWMYKSGAIELGFLFLWLLETLAPADLQRRVPDMSFADAERARSLLARMQANPSAAFAQLPLVEPDLAALAPYATKWFDNERAEAAGADREMLDALAGSSAAVLVTCGWSDLFIEGSIELFETARSRWADPQDVPDRLIIGPWAHGNPTDWQGDIWCGYAASTAAVSDEQLAFFDAAFAGAKPSSPMVRYFRTGSNTWHAAPDWPLSGAGQRSLFLAGDDKSLQFEPVSEDWGRGYTSDPLHPVPTVGGASFLPGLLLGRNSGPKDQRLVEAREDVLIFTSSSLEEDLEVTGLVEAHLWVSSSAVSCDWAIKLCEVDASGRSLGIVDGIHRWHWTGDGAIVDPREIVVRLGHIGHLFRKGSRLRVQIASSNFPRFDRNPQSGAPSTTATANEFMTSRQTVHGGLSMPSRIILPVVPAPFPVINGLTDVK